MSSISIKISVTYSISDTNITEILKPEVLHICENCLYCLFRLRNIYMMKANYLFHHKIVPIAPISSRSNRYRNILQKTC